MPFIRHLRDKRGYETTVVMHAYRPAQGPQRTRVLYLFRSPSSLKIGRQPLDEEIREALEHTHPDVSFDWMGLDREAAAMRRDEHRDRDRDRDRDRGGRQRPAGRVGPRPAEPVRVVIEDDTLLGRTMGGEAAAALRRQYAELLQRVARRARTPEERDRLTEEAQRLNPDEWPDEGVIRTMASTADADRLAVTSALPARRRGRRAGRRRDQDGRELAGTAGESESGEVESDGSDRAIMAGDGDSDEDRDVSDSTDVAPAASDRQFHDRAGAEPADDRPAGDGLSIDDQRRPD